MNRNEEFYALLKETESLQLRSDPVKKALKRNRLLHPELYLLILPQLRFRKRCEIQIQIIILNALHRHPGFPLLADRSIPPGKLVQIAFQVHIG